MSLFSLLKLYITGKFRNGYSLILWTLLSHTVLYWLVIGDLGENTVRKVDLFVWVGNSNLNNVTSDFYKN